MDTNGHTILFEDYVSFEIAKLLKERGFDGECHGYYEVPTKLSSHKNVSKQLNTLPKNWNEYNKECVVCEYISISTHQMALKWLREVHNICIVIRPYVMEDGICYCYETKKLHTDMVEPIKNQAGYTIYEEAVEAALKYTLENLI